MKKLSYLIVLALILSLVLTGCLLSNVGQVPTSEQSGITYLTKGPGNLVGLWHFDEGTGDKAYDSSGNYNDGTLHNFSVPYGWVTGMFGSALSFDGVDDYVEVPNSSSIEFEGKSNITMEAWVYPRSYHAERGIVLEHIAQYYFTIDKNGKLAVYFYGVSPAGYYISTSQVPLNTWTHIAATYNSSSVQLYINGELSGITPATGTIKYASGWSDQPLRMGYERPGLTRYFDGIIDEVRIWDVALVAFPVPVAMDIKPGSCPNPLNTKSKGVTPVAILGTEDFDVTEINPGTIKLIGILTDVAPLSWNWEDVATPFEPYIGKIDCDLDCNTEGPDGYLDLTLKFGTQALLDVIGTVESFEVSEEELNALESGESDQVTTTSGEILFDGDCLVIQLEGSLFDGTPIIGEDVVRILKKGNK